MSDDGEVTPAKMLREYRRSSPEVVREEADRFCRLSVHDQLELLFYMSVSNVQAIQFVHGLIDIEAAQTQSFKDIETPTQ